MLSFALQVIFLLLFLGGIIAYIGNYVGRWIGKRRLTIFNLRPRYTATAITVISGIIIALSTIVVLLLVSQDARTALFGLGELRKEIKLKSEELEKTNLELKRKLLFQRELENKLSAAKKEMAALQAAKEKLSREIRITRQGQVLFKVGEMVSLSLIQAGPEKEKIEAGLRQILSAADSYLRSLGIKSDRHLIYMLPEDFDQALADLTASRKTYVVKLVATRNVLWGEEVPARFELIENKLIYKEGQKIAELDIPAGLSAAQVEQEIMRLLKLSHEAAREAGVLPDPSGSLGSVPYSDIFDLAKKIVSNNKKVTLRVLAKNNIYAIGPLEVRFQVVYK